MKLNRAKPKKKKPSSLLQPKPLPVHNLFVANRIRLGRKTLRISFDADSANVISGEVIFHGNTRRSAGYGFVSFNSKVEAEAEAASAA
ncbi:UNVERIFIED_CONTAM: hypothetical protein Sradi_3528000 [Sesamum radiatum]|uniref:RRM domain-containing protein n=1 Tax=Sesamum radiatum TaxID=300843 RepID=A0AAW2QER9_SESRA